MKKNFLKLDKTTRQRTKATIWIVAIISLILSISILVEMLNNETPEGDKPLIIVYMVIFVVVSLFCGIIGIFITIWDKNNPNKENEIDLANNEKKLTDEEQFVDRIDTRLDNNHVDIIENTENNVAGNSDFKKDSQEKIELTEEGLERLQSEINAKERELFHYTGSAYSNLKVEINRDKERLLIMRRMLDLHNLNNLYQLKSEKIEDIYLELKEKNLEEKDIKNYLGLKIYSMDTSKSLKSCTEQANNIIVSQKYKEFLNKHSKYLKKLSTNMSEMLNNETLVKITTNFVKSNELNDLEILATPTQIFIKTYAPIYNFDILNKKQYSNIFYTLNAGLNSYVSSRGYFENIQKKKNSDIKDLQYDNPLYFFNMLIKQRIITNNELNRDTFFILLSELARKNKIEIFGKLKEKYKIENESDNEIVEKLYKLGYGVPEITQFVSLKRYVEKGDAPYESIEDEMTEEVETRIEDLREKKYLDSLLSDNVKTKKNIADVDLMSGFEFETFIANMFADMGYRTERTKSSGDQGVDVIATKNDTVIAIQAKCYSGVVGNHAIMEAVGGMKFYNANKCMVITNSTFTKSAIELARANNVELWDRQTLKEKMDELM